MIFYHYTSRMQLGQIMSVGELLMTANPFTPKEYGKAPVVWLTDQDGSVRSGDTLCHGLNLAQHQLGRAVDRIEVRFTVDVPRDEVLDWEQFCEQAFVPKRTMRKMDKWPLRPQWWYAISRSIPHTEWVEIGVGRDAWTPMFAPGGDIAQHEESISD